MVLSPHHQQENPDVRHRGFVLRVGIEPALHFMGTPV